MKNGQKTNMYTNQDPNTNWNRVAWAFLKVVGSDKTLNTEKKIRLQLFYYPNNKKIKMMDTLVPDVYYYYKNGNKFKYPSTLHVTVKSILAPRKFQPGLRSIYYIDKEDAADFYANVKTDDEKSGEETERAIFSSDNDENDPSVLKVSDNNGSNDWHASLEEQTKHWLSKKALLWSRLSGQLCRIPNELSLTLQYRKKRMLFIKIQYKWQLLSNGLCRR